MGEGANAQQAGFTQRKHMRVSFSVTVKKQQPVKRHMKKKKKRAKRKI